MTDISSAGLPNTPRSLGRFEPPAGLFARIGAALVALAGALAEAKELRRQAKLRYPYLSDEA